MINLKILSAAAAIALVTPMVLPSESFAQKNPKSAACAAVVAVVGPLPAVVAAALPEAVAPEPCALAVAAAVSAAARLVRIQRRRV